MGIVARAGLAAASGLLNLGGGATGPTAFRDYLNARSPHFIYPFNETSGTNIDDYSAGNRDGVYVSADLNETSSWTNYPSEKAVRCGNAQNTTLRAENHMTSGVAGATGITVVAIIKPNGLQGEDDVVFEGQQGAGETIIHLRFAGTWGLKSLTRSKSDNSDTNTVTTADNVLTSGSWHLVGVVADYTNDIHDIYVDGVKVATGTPTFTSNTIETGSPSASWYDRFASLPANNGGWYEGWIDNGGVCLQAFSAAEMSALYDTWDGGNAA